MPRVLPLLFAVLAAASALPLTQACSAQSPAPAVSPATDAKLRRLLPFPDATLSPAIEANAMGLDYDLDQGFFIFCNRMDPSGQIVSIQRQMTGGAEDAARYRALGRLYRRAGLASKSQAAFQQSETLYQAVLTRQANDGAALAGYGRTLQSARQLPAAEAYLRKAVLIVPKSADVWLALGFVLDDEASPQTEAKTHWGRDAGRAYDMAVALAPNNPAAWVMRGEYRTWDLPQLYGKMFSRDALGDYERAAFLLPHDPDAQAMIAWTDCETFGMSHHMFTGAKASKMEPPASDRRAKAILQRINAIAQSTRGAQSASAYTAQAWVQFEFFWDHKAALKSLALALRQNSRQQDAIDYQMHVAAVTGDDVLLAAACRRELHRRPQVYLRVLLADADFNIAQQKPVYWNEARTQMEMAHAAAPHDDALRLGVAVLLLKSGQAADLSRAGVLLGEIAPSAPGRSKAQQADFDLTRGIAAALAGRQEEARTLLGSALQDDPHNRPAKAVLALL